MQAVERLGGLQAQSTPSPYLSLWTRLEGFERDELTRALTGRRLVKALLQRGTLHVATPRHVLGDHDRAPRAGRVALAAVVRGAAAGGADRGARGGRAAELDGSELTFKEVRALLEPHAREGVPPTFLWRRVQGHAYVMHVPPSGIWGYGGHGVYTAATGRCAASRPSRRRRSTGSSAPTSPPTGRRRSRTSASGPACRG